MAADIHAVVTELGLRHPAIVGCSMGGTIALQYTLDYPADLSRLVVLASFAGLPEQMAQTRDDQLAFIQSHTLREIAENRVGAAFTAGADQDVRAWMVDMIAGGDKEGYESEAHTTLTFDVRPRLKEIAVPTTIIHGEKTPQCPSPWPMPWPRGSPAPPCTSSLAKAISPTSRPRKRSTRSSPTRSESQRNLSRSGRRTGPGGIRLVRRKRGNGTVSPAVV